MQSSGQLVNTFARSVTCVLRRAPSPPRAGANVKISDTPPSPVSPPTGHGKARKSARWVGHLSRKKRNKGLQPDRTRSTGRKEIRHRGLSEADREAWRESRRPPRSAGCKRRSPRARTRHAFLAAPPRVGSVGVGSVGVGSVGVGSVDGGASSDSPADSSMLPACGIRAGGNRCGSPSAYGFGRALSAGRRSRGKLSSGASP